MIRALVTPWPGAYYYDVKGQKVTVDYFLLKSVLKEIRDKEIYNFKKDFENYCNAKKVKKNA